MATFQANSKFIKAEQSQPKPRPNFSKKKAWISLDFLVGNEPFQRIMLTPWGKKVFSRSFPRRWPARPWTRFDAVPNHDAMASDFRKAKSPARG
ncbi:MAG: hypothetical protein WBA40_13300 [Roseiarcus sp.]